VSFNILLFLILQILCNGTFILQIIKALNLYRKKTGSEKFFWVRNNLLDS